jgi:hypothetical protein
MDPAPFTRYLVTFAATMVGIIGLVWAYTAAFPIAFMESGYASWTAKKTMLHDCQLGQIAFFGDSRLEAGVRPTDLPIPATNFGLAAGTAIETRVAIDRALTCPTLPHQAVISLAPEHFGPVSSFFWVLSIRYGFLSAGDVLAIERLADDLGDDTTLATPTPDGLSGQARDWLYAAGFPSFSFGNLVQGRVFGRYDVNQARFASVIADRGWAPYVGGNPVHVEHPDRFIITALQTAELEAALSTLRAHSVPAAFLIMPFSTAHGESDALLTAYRTYLSTLAQRTGATMLDEIPFWPPKFFAEGTHLEPAAAHAFTTKLAACLHTGLLTAPCDLSAPPSPVLEMQQ